MSRTFTNEELEILFITPQDVNVEGDAFAGGGDTEAEHDGEDVIEDDRYRAYQRYASLPSTTRPN
jgi:hypothetical protein